MNLRILKSSTSKSLNSCLEAYQRLRQSSMIPMRNPVGFTFWPMGQRPLGLVPVLAIGCPGLEGLQVGQADLDVRAAAADHVGHAAGPRHQPLEHRAAVAPGVD